MFKHRVICDRDVYATSDLIQSEAKSGPTPPPRYFGAYSLDYPTGRMTADEFVHESGKLRLFDQPPDAIEAAFELATKRLEELAPRR
jgi:hypothetical protein